MITFNTGCQYLHQFVHLHMFQKPEEVPTRISNWHQRQLIPSPSCDRILVSVFLVRGLSHTNSVRVHFTTLSISLNHPCPTANLTHDVSYIKSYTRFYSLALTPSEKDTPFHISRSLLAYTELCKLTQKHLQDIFAMTFKKTPWAFSAHCMFSSNLNVSRPYGVPNKSGFLVWHSK